ncbi:unnamed protein product [Chironomus riparius]|uniref:Uncharacterized protein n=1 Tax=Chironomus riparius TaxID=315576 RepID=A0A9N9WXB7_9DIPT|nr:unnamed protein product [Chironomus riparius]
MRVNGKILNNGENYRKYNYRRVRHGIAVNERARLFTYYPDSDDDSNDDDDVYACMYAQQKNKAEKKENYEQQ